MVKLTEEFLKAQEDRALITLLCDKAYDLAGETPASIKEDPTPVSEMVMTISELERRIREDGLREVFHPVLRILGDVPGRYLSPDWVCAAAVQVSNKERSIIRNPFSDWLHEFKKEEPQAP